MAKKTSEAAPAPAAPAKKEHMKEELPEALVKGLKAGGYKGSAEEVLATRSYDAQKIYRCVTSDGQRHEISYDGKRLKGGSIAYQKEAAKKKKEKAAK